MIFKKPLEKITYKDVVDFCNSEIRENEVLDYKEEFPAKLEKIIAAYANTYGGLVIIGVEDNDGKPVKKPLGIKYVKGLEEKVTQIILSNITPPLFPEIHFVKPKNGKTFLLIQVAQSSNTPHSIANNTKVYLRTGSITKPERLADLNELHWLSRNRENSVYFRSDLISAANDKYLSLYAHCKAKINFAELRMYCLPQYPSFHSVDIDTMKDLKQNMSTYTVTTGGGSFFPSIGSATLKTAQDSIYLFRNDKEKSREFTEFTWINSFGLVLHYEDVGTLSKNNEHYVSSRNIIYAFVNLLNFYRNIRSKLNMWGDYKLRLMLLKMNEVKVTPINSARPFFGDIEPFLGKGYSFDRIITNHHLSNVEKTEELLIEFIKDFQWSFGTVVDENTAKKWIEENGVLKLFKQQK